MTRILLTLITTAPLSAAAQQIAPLPPVALRPATPVIVPPAQPQVDPTQLRLAAMRQDIDRLRADLAATQKALADTTAQLSFASGLLTSLNTRFLAHYHRVKGDVGNGFSSGYDGSHIYISYMMPIKDDSAQYHARETSGPLP